MKALRPLRLFIPVIAIGAALALFITVGLVAFQGGGARSASGGCAASAGAAGAGSGSGEFGSDTVRTGSTDLTDEQRQNAALIIGAAKGVGAPPRAWLVALATAMQESGLRNLDHGDRDSLGLFQQRPSQGWGTPAEVTDPVHATTTFIQHLQQVPGWDQLPVTVAAQLVQRSAFPEAYAKWENLAGQLVSQLAGVADITSCGPGGATLPVGIVQTAISFAMAALGKPYVWGATGPSSYDCSGLVLRAFQAAGIELPRVSRDQYWAGGHVPVAQAQPGDLLFLANDPSDPSTIHHVMIYLGNNTIAEAPFTGKPVRTRSFSWNESELVPLATRPGTAANPA